MTLCVQKVIVFSEQMRTRKTENNAKRCENFSANFSNRGHENRNRGYYAGGTASNHLIVRTLRAKLKLCQVCFAWLNRLCCCMLFEPTFEGSLYLQIGIAPTCIFIVQLIERTGNISCCGRGLGGKGGGVLPFEGLMGTCGQPGYFFRDFCLKQGIDFIIFCLKQSIDFNHFS